MKNNKFIGILRFFVMFSVFGSIAISCNNKVDSYLEESTRLKKYIADNNITTAPTSSGLYYIETHAGTGEQAKAGLMVSVRYKGYLLDGTVFDQNLDSANPFSFTLGYGYVISGWDEGIAKMKVGGTATLIIPSSLAYGYTGTTGIPAYSTLIFEVELVNVQ